MAGNRLGGNYGYDMGYNDPNQVISSGYGYQQFPKKQPRANSTGTKKDPNSKLAKMKQLRGGLGRDITLLCLGIQSGFPTKISMNIRELYHTGD